MQGGGNALQQPSRFLAELPKALLDEWNLRPTFGGRHETPAAPPDPDPDPDPEYDGDSPF